MQQQLYTQTYYMCIGYSRPINVAAHTRHMASHTYVYVCCTVALNPHVLRIETASSRSVHTILPLVRCLPWHLLEGAI